MEDQIVAEQVVAVPETEFSLVEWHALQRLQERYLQDHDLLDACECDRLRFLRWLRQTGRLDPPA